MGTVSLVVMTISLIINLVLANKLVHLRMEKKRIKGRYNELVDLLVEPKKPNKVEELIDAIGFMTITDSYTKYTDEGVRVVVEFENSIKIEDYMNANDKTYKIRVLYNDTIINGMSWEQAVRMLKTCRNKLSEKVIDEFCYNQQKQLSFPQQDPLY